MTAYLSPEKFRISGTGIDLTGVSDLELASLLDEATVVTDAYCNMPLVPVGASFLGGSAVESHRWPFPAGMVEKPKRRVYPYHWPVKDVSDLRIIVGEGASAVIPVDEIVINNTERWVEVTSLTIASNSGLFGVGGWLVPIGGLQEPVAQLTVDYGFDIAEVSDRCFAIDGTNLVFASSHEHWIQDATTPAVYVGGTLASPQPAIDYLLGRVTFNSAQTGRVTATYRHKLPTEIERAQPYIAAYLRGKAILRSKDMEGLQSIRDDEIEIARPRMVPKIGVDFDTAVPDAALLLSGFRHWRIG